jgi:DNA-directed RNA polymerase I, II, and III subunit RPABC5
MIIPVRCYSCGKLISTKYQTYLNKVIEQKKKENLPIEDTILNVMTSDLEKSIEGKVMDDLGITRLCCRKIFLGHVDYN